MGGAIGGADVQEWHQSRKPRMQTLMSEVVLTLILLAVVVLSGRL
jgi:hypothetical protein